MPASNPYAKYRATSIQTLTPGELIVLLYEEAILSANRAVYHLKANKISDAHDAIIKAENIVLYLMEILDMSVPISQQLFELYEFIYKQLVKANTEKSIPLLGEVVSLLNELKDTWRQAETDIHQKQSIGELSV